MAELRRVMVGVCGGVAAYKAAELVRLLQKADVEVRVTMTRAAEEFVRPLTFSSLTGHRVMRDLWSQDGPDAGEAAIEHIAEAQWAELLVVAPATAHTLGKFANGLADDFLSTMYLATTAPVVVAPAMNVNMWGHAAVAANVERLRTRGVRVVAPGDGYLACGMVGGGRMAEVEVIAGAVLEELARVSAGRRDLAGETVLVTAGGTREPIDPVRFVGNRSSGRMGHAVAERAAKRGARVMLVTASAMEVGPGVEVVRVDTAEAMRVAVMARLPLATMVVGAAAVADFRPRRVAAQKIKRGVGAGLGDGGVGLTVEMEATADVLVEVVRERAAGTLVVAFAAETEDLLARAREKLARKGVDAVVANDVSGARTGFDVDRNAALFVTREGVVELPESSKGELAERILDEVIRVRQTISLAQTTSS